MVRPTNTRDKRETTPSRISFDVGAFTELIQDQGVYIKITPSILCPNRDEEFSTNHKINCNVCEGEEAVDLISNSFEAWAFIQAVDLKLDWRREGVLNIKDAQMSIDGTVRLWYYDKIEILDHTSIYNEVIKRTGNINKLRYNAIIDAQDTNFFMIDSDGILYERVTDYTISGQELTWLDTKGPPQDTLYSIQYPMLPTFRVLELLHENRYYYEDNKNPTKVPIHLPQQCVIRWDFLAKRKGANEDLITE